MDGRDIANGVAGGMRYLFLLGLLLGLALAGVIALVGGAAWLLWRAST